MVTKSANVGRAGLSDAELRAFAKVYHDSDGVQNVVHRVTGLSRSAVQNRIHQCKKRGIITETRSERREREFKEAGFGRDALPDPLPPVEDLLDERRRKFEVKKKAKEARRLVPIRVALDGPIGIAHMGDPHVDDDGTDIAELQRHVELINETEGLFGANVGDLQNNWVGRLARLYGQQGTSQAEAWALTEWLVNSVPWLYLIGGNHDAWSGAGDPLRWLMRGSVGVTEYFGARIDLRFPNGKRVRVNARHDFSGHSQWNAAHGVGKAVQMGWRDHILTCGHRHVSGLMHLKCPATGLLSWAIRTGSYKIYDRYAEEKGLPDQSAFRCPVTIIQPQYEDHDPRLVSVFLDPEQAASYLRFLRRES